MIALIVADRCTACGACVEVCPTNVFDAALAGPPVIARVEDCQTCFMCELYCRPDAIYVDPDADLPVILSEETVLASGTLGRFRAHSGWDEWDGTYPNEMWRMELVFRRAGESAARKAGSP